MLEKKQTSFEEDFNKLSSSNFKLTQLPVTNP